jgi:glycosyltransferase involved in cell wall biosynthesis
MKIAINAIPYVRWSGIETFLSNLLVSWPIDRRDELVIFANQESAKFFPGLPANIKIRVKNFKKLSRLQLFIYQQIGLPLTLWREKFDILFCASLLGPWVYSQKIITIHDAAPFVLKEENSRLGKIFWQLNLFFARLASLKIITVSQFSQDELIKHLKIEAKKIAIIYNGSPDYKIGTGADIFNSSQAPNDKYIIAVGNARPRKNLERLIRAFKLLGQQNPNLKLVIVGKNDWRMEEITNIVGDLANKIIFTGFISEAEKQNLIKQASALVFPSVYEGFGLPIVEANVLGTPVICSDIPSFREVAGESAIFFNPLDEHDIAAKINELIGSSELAAALSARGKINAQRFNWVSSAQKLTAIIHQYENPTNK